MSVTTIEVKFRPNGVLTDATSVVLEDPTGLYGVKRTDTQAVVIPATTPIPRTGLGTYAYTFTDPAFDLTYRYAIKIIYQGETSYVQGLIEGTPSVAPPEEDPDVVIGYISLTDANDYFEHLGIPGPWTTATNTEKIKALRQGTAIINRLRYRGQKTAIEQVNAFPRNGSNVIPEPVSQACCEIAKEMLDSYDPNLERNDLSITSQGMVSIRSTQDKPYMELHKVAGVPSIVAWHMLLPYLADARSITLQRVS